MVSQRSLLEGGMLKVVACNLKYAAVINWQLLEGKVELFYLTFHLRGLEISLNQAGDTISMPLAKQM